MVTKVFNPTETLITINTHTIVGYAEDETIDLTIQGEGHTVVKDLYGNPYRIKDPFRSVKIMIKLLQASSSNAFLTTMRILDDTASSGVATIVIKNQNNIILSSAKCFVTKMPDVTLGKDLKSTSWELECLEPQLSISSFVSDVQGGAF